MEQAEVEVEVEGNIDLSVDPSDAVPEPPAAVTVSTSAAEEAYDALAHSLAGAGGGCIALALTYPLLTATTRLQIQHNQSNQHKYSNLLDVIVKTSNDEGWTKLYAGLKAALAGNIVSMGVYYYWYALLMSLAQGMRRARMTTIDSKRCMRHCCCSGCC
jgi:solute carrier family 25 (peroxisomal adenine nucleotide transporter), member 17